MKSPPNWQDSSGRLSDGTVFLTFLPWRLFFFGMTESITSFFRSPIWILLLLKLSDGHILHSLRTHIWNLTHRRRRRLWFDRIAAAIYINNCTLVSGFTLPIPAHQRIAIAIRTKHSKIFKYSTNLVCKKIQFLFDHGNFEVLAGIFGYSTDLLVKNISIFIGSRILLVGISLPQYLSRISQFIFDHIKFYLKSHRRRQCLWALNHLSW